MDSISMNAPRIFCDFNGLIEQNHYSLDSVGTREDLANLGLQLLVGMSVLLYDYDAFESGEPAWLLADAEIVELPGWGLVARTDDRSFRWEPRAEPV